MRLFIIFIISFPLFAQSTLEGQAKKTPWGGHWWTMRGGELALGWDDGLGRKQVSPKEAKNFDECLVSQSKECKKVMSSHLANNGLALSPLMKFDLWVKKLIDEKYTAAPVTYYSRATTNELKIHYIDSSKHPHYAVRGFAGKCTGWSLANLDFAEPTKTKTINGITFTPADIKGILAAIYYGGQFFVPEEMYLGNAYRSEGADNRKDYYDDPAPHDLIMALEKHIKEEGKIIVADMDPSEGVWNHPIYAYSVKLNKQAGNKVRGEMTLKYAADEVNIDDVFSNKTQRSDLIERTLQFELTVGSEWKGEMNQVISGRWIGDSVDKHPDSLLLGLEKNWRQNIYQYKNTNMKLEVNFQLIKKVNLGNGFKVIVDELLKEYYKQ